MTPDPKGHGRGHGSGRGHARGQWTRARSADADTHADTGTERLRPTELFTAGTTDAERVAAYALKIAFPLP